MMEVRSATELSYSLSVANLSYKYVVILSNHYTGEHLLVYCNYHCEVLSLLSKYHAFCLRDKERFTCICTLPTQVYGTNLQKVIDDTTDSTLFSLKLLCFTFVA